MSARLSPPRMPLIRLGLPCFHGELPVCSWPILPTVPARWVVNIYAKRSVKDRSNSPTQKPGYAEGNEKMRLQILTLAAAMTLLAACDTDKKTDTAAAATSTGPGSTG